MSGSQEAVVCLEEMSLVSFLIWIVFVFKPIAFDLKINPFNLVEEGPGQLMAFSILFLYLVVSSWSLVIFFVALSKSFLK